MKNDITYEYRVFTNRLIDIESMEVGNCTSKVIKNIKPKDKVDGRFFHTSDTDEWFFCWNGELQKLNLKGDSDINAALAEVEKLIADAKKTADEAKVAASEAQTAADAASAAVESIKNKAEQSVVDELSNVVDSLSKNVESKANKSDIEELSGKVALKSDLEGVVKKSELSGYATTEFVNGKIAEIKVPTKVSDLDNDSKYLTKEDIKGKQDVIGDLEVIRTNMALAKTALQSIPEEYVTETELGGKGYLTVAAADLKYAPIGSTGSDVTKNYVDTELAKKQDKIDDIDKIATALQPGDLKGYVTEDELNKKGYLTEQDITGKQNVIENLDEIISGAAAGATALQESDLEGYITEDELNKKGYLTEDTLSNSNAISGINSQIAAINDLLGEATNITNTILA